MSANHSSNGSNSGCCQKDEPEEKRCLVPVTAPARRHGYCPDWARCLTPSTFGELLIKVGSCLHTLVSACDGMLRYRHGKGVEVASTFDLDQPHGPKEEIERGRFALAEPIEHCCSDGSKVEGWRHKVQTEPESRNAGRLAVIDTDCDGFSRIDTLVPKEVTNAAEGAKPLYGQIIPPTKDCDKATILWTLANHPTTPNCLPIPEYEGIEDADCDVEVEPVFVRKRCDDGSNTICIYWREKEEEA